MRLPFTTQHTNYWVKRAMTAFEKWKEDNMDPDMTYMCLRTTPMDNNQHSPGELLCGRMLSINLEYTTATQADLASILTWDNTNSCRSNTMWSKHYPQDCLPRVYNSSIFCQVDFNFQVFFLVVKWLPQLQPLVSSLHNFWGAYQRYQDFKERQTCFKFVHLPKITDCCLFYWLLTGKQFPHLTQSISGYTSMTLCNVHGKRFPYNAIHSTWGSGLINQSSYFVLGSVAVSEVDKGMC